MEGGVVAPDRIIRSIDSFAEVVTHYLMPVIRWVGHKDDLFEALSRVYPGLVHERKYSGEPADLVVFDELPLDLVTPTLELTADSAYLFCLQEKEPLLLGGSENLARLNALTLVSPDAEKFLWHVKALLLIKDLAYSNGEATFADLLSIDRQHRRALALVVDAVLGSRSCVVTVPSEGYKQVLLEFLFGAMPEIIAPVYIDPSSLVPELLAQDRFNIVTNTKLENIELSTQFAIESGVDKKRPLMFIATHNEPLETPEDGLFHISLEDWDDRLEDAHLIAYWVAAWRSHATGFVSFYTSECIESVNLKANHDPIDARQILMEQTPGAKEPDKALLEVMDTYQRLSVDNILGEAERQIMMKLKEHSPLVEAASHAAGIPLVTFHKRNRRLEQKANLLRLLTSIRKT